MERTALVGPTPAATVDSTIRRRAPFRQWIHGVKRFLAPLYIGGNVALVVLILTYIPLHLYIGSDGNFCDLGLAEIDSQVYFNLGPSIGQGKTTVETMATSLNSLFSLNPLPIRIFWGPYTFPAVKAMDIVWNLLVGRGGQTVAGIFTIQTITAWLIQTMGSCPVPHDMFMESIFSRGSSFSAIWQFTRPKAESLIWSRHKLQLMTFALCMAYVLAFPTLTSAASGYMAQSEIYFREPDGSLGKPNENKWQDPPTVVFAIDNGHLIGQSDPVYFWTLSDPDINGFARPGNPPTVAFYNDSSVMKEFARLYDHCQENCNMFRSLDSGNFTFPANETLKMRFIESEDSDWNLRDPVFIVEDQFYTLQDAMDLVVCVSMEKYFWGFSYHLLFLWSILNLFHAVALWVTWQRLTGSRGIRVSYGIRRAAVDFTTMTRDLMGIDIHTTTEKEIQKTLNHRKAGLVIPDPHNKVFTRAWSSNSEVDK